MATVALCASALYVHFALSLLAWTVLPMVAGLRPVLIVSDSMAPAINAGDIVLTSRPPDTVKAGAVVVFDDPAHPGRLLTHRVVTRAEDGTLRTKGDANPLVDSSPVPAASVRGVGKAIVPAIGVPFLWLKAGQWAVAALWAAATVLALTVVTIGVRPPVRRRWTTGIATPAPVIAAVSPSPVRPAPWWEPAPRPPRSRIPRPAVVAITAVVAVGLAVPRIMTAQAAFSDAAQNPGNEFVAATSFCTNPGSQTVTAGGDAKVVQNSATTNFGTAADLAVDPRNNRAVRSLVHFPLPARPSGCVMTATLRVYTTTAAAGRTLQAWRAGGPWTETAVTWNTQPATAGTAPATAASLAAPGWVDFPVTDLVNSLYAGTNNGFLLKDSVESAGANLGQVLSSLSGGNPPQLVLDFGATPSRPVAPSSLTATALSASRVGLTWQDNSTNESGFLVQRAPGGTGTWTSIAAVSADVTTFTDTGLTSETAYDYRVRATNALGDSPASNIASVTTPASPPPPAAPAALSVTATTFDSVSLTWTDMSTDEDQFVIERSPAGAGTWTVAGTVGPDVTTFVSNGLLANTAYDHRVQARNNGGSSGWSNVATATTAACATVPAQTLTATADTLLLQGAGGDTNYGSDAVNFGIRSLDLSNARSLVRFAAPTLPGGCAITSATLRVYETSGDVGRTIEAIPAAATWSESSVTWNTQPATTGTAAAVVSAVGWNAWTVTSHVGTTGTGAPHGFLLRDAAENNATALRQYYSPREGSNPPQLVVRFD